jgi:hypothetical protein
MSLQIVDATESKSAAADRRIENGSSRPIHWIVPREPMRRETYRVARHRNARKTVKKPRFCGVVFAFHEKHDSTACFVF